MTNNHVWAGPTKAAESMPEDLRWLAEVCEEWPEHEKAVNITIVGPRVASFDWRDDGDWNKAQWLQARKDLGLIMSDEEEEIPAEASGKRSLYDEIKEGFEDMVNHPPHYQLREGYEVYDLRQDLAKKAARSGVPHDQYSDWDRALEYLLRMWEKNGVEDAKKGRWYMDKLIEKMERNNDR